MATASDKNISGDSEKAVRDRLLDVAEELFAVHGFDGTSIRELAAAAECNIAAVNYYFGGKEKLYEEVFRRHLTEMREIRVSSIDRVMAESKGRPELEDLLGAFADAFLEPLAAKARASRFMELMGREMVERRLPRDVFAKEMILPTMSALKGALLKACPGLDESRVPFVVYSVVGQLLHAIHARPIIDGQQDAGVPEYDLGKFIEHVVEFSAGGIRAVAGEKAE